ncbi:membrane-associated protein, putative [Bodo saltans]|uniref:Membrane-associated protein, putative n=1 Tax=Bodo saltans TaxID=75058 RepID=A0A0S4JS62_BODSA|nr:membrane-associated protein, putative [Bodo saltans]|eukprot:CUG92231.1 membrane-associated protein, putative [Bodo saltans]
MYTGFLLLGTIGQYLSVVMIGISIVQFLSTIIGILAWIKTVGVVLFSSKNAFASSLFGSKSHSIVLYRNEEGDDVDSVDGTSTPLEIGTRSSSSSSSSSSTIHDNDKLMDSKELAAIESFLLHDDSNDNFDPILLDANDSRHDEASHFADCEILFYTLKDGTTIVGSDDYHHSSLLGLSISGTRLTSNQLLEDFGPIAPREE